MKKIKWIVLLLIFSLIIPVQVFASTDNATLPKPGILPGNMFYGLDSLIERIQVGLTFNPLMKADLLDKIAGERLSESEVLVKKEKLELGQETLTKYQDTVNQMLEIVSKEILKGTDVTETINKIYDNSKGHTAILENIYDSLSSEQVDSIYENLNAVEHIKNANDLFSAGEENQIASSEQSPWVIDEDTLDALLSMDKENALSLDEIISSDIYNRDTINAFYSLANNSGETVKDVITEFFSNRPQYEELASKFGLDLTKAIRYANMDVNDMLEWVYNFIESVDTERMTNILDKFDYSEP